jgi:repressor LexA
MKTSKEQGVESRALIMGAIVNYMLQYDYPPTTREICELTGLKSTSTVNHHLAKMAEQGLIEYQEGQPRTIRVPGIKYIDERGRV